MTSPRKVREWTTLDLIVNYTFNLPQTVTEQVPGYARDAGKNADMKDGKDKNVIPVSTAEYNPCGWRAWLNNTTITLGMNNVFDQDPPFSIFNSENGYDHVDGQYQGANLVCGVDEAFLKLLPYLETQWVRRLWPALRRMATMNPLPRSKASSGTFS